MRRKSGDEQSRARLGSKGAEDSDLVQPQPSAQHCHQQAWDRAPSFLYALLSLWEWHVRPSNLASHLKTGLCSVAPMAVTSCRIVQSWQQSQASCDRSSRNKASLQYITWISAALVRMAVPSGFMCSRVSICCSATCCESPWAVQGYVGKNCFCFCFFSSLKLPYNIKSLC